jgi:hypothetical protein
MKRFFGVSLIAASLLTCTIGQSALAAGSVYLEIKKQAYQIPQPTPALEINAPNIEMRFDNRLAYHLGIYSGSDILDMMGYYDEKQAIDANRAYAVIYYNGAKTNNQINPNMPNSPLEGWLIAANGDVMTECMKAIRSTRNDKSLYFQLVKNTELPAIQGVDFGKMKVKGYQIANDIIDMDGLSTGPMYLMSDFISCTNW